MAGIFAHTQYPNPALGSLKTQVNRKLTKQLKYLLLKLLKTRNPLIQAHKGPHTRPAWGLYGLTATRVLGFSLLLAVWRVPFSGRALFRAGQR